MRWGGYWFGGPNMGGARHALGRLDRRRWRLFRRALAASPSNCGGVLEHPRLVTRVDDDSDSICRREVRRMD